MTPYYQTESGTLYNGDCVDIMKGFEDNSIDCCVTSPPYDNLRNYKGFSFDFENTAKELYRIIKKGGIVVWVVGDATIKGSETGTSFKQALYFKEIGFNLHDTMIFQKINYIPLTHRRYEQSFEYMFILSKGRPKTFNPFMKDNKSRGQLYNTRRPRPYDNHSIRHNRDEIRIHKDKSIRPNIFSYLIGCGNSRTDHPATFPNKLAEDHILSWSNENDIILDPFCGSGTTALMAEKLNRKWIGIEISKEYCEIIKKRLSLNEPALPLK